MGGSLPANSSWSARSRLRSNEVSRSRQVELPADAIAADPGPLIHLSKLCKQFGTDAIVRALTDIDLQVWRGEWLSITGPSGSGKSTLLNVLGCLDRPTSGQYLLDGVDTTKLSGNQRAGLRSRHIGFIFQAFHLLPYRSVLENVMLAEVYRRQTIRGRRERAMEKFAASGWSIVRNSCRSNCRAANVSGWR